VTEDQPRTAAGSNDACTPAGLFDLLWNDVADIMGTGAIAALLRRAIKQAALVEPHLNEITIGRDGLEYSYDLPASWREACNDRSLSEIRGLIDSLGPLLVQLTGPVVVRRLQRLEPLREQALSDRG
jgi:hypothetical protein